MLREEILRERASFARDLEYVRSITEDAKVQDTMLMLDEHSKAVRGIFEEDGDDEKVDSALKEAIDQIPTDDDKDAEIQRILTAKKDVSIDNIMGIIDDSDDEEADAVDLAVDMLEDDEEDE